MFGLQNAARFCPTTPTLSAQASDGDGLRSPYEGAWRNPNPQPLNPPTPVNPNPATLNGVFRVSDDEASRPSYGG